jgi:RNA polymerase sigma-70 factor (ECF subfamily)
MTDHQLIELIINENNQSAFTELVNRHQSLVIRTCLGFVSTHADAEDLAQEVFIEVYQSLSGFRNEAKLSTWLYRIAVNKSLNFIRKNKRDKVLHSIESFFSGSSKKNEILEIEDSTTLTPENKMQAKEEKLMLKEAINSLPENQRIAFILSKYQDLSYKEIAEVMNVSLSSVESLLFRAKANLQKKLISKIKKT